MRTFKDFFTGEGISKYEADAFDKLQNVDAFSEIGTVKCQLKLKKDSSTTITEPVILVPVPDGTVYALGKTTGKIWSITVSGTYALAHTNANTAHKGGSYFNGYLYYSTASKLGRFDLSSTWTDSFADYDNDDTNKPMVEHNNSLSLYIGDGKDIASVDSSGNFTTSALDLPSQYKTTALSAYGDDLIIGTQVSTNYSSSKIYRWNTYSSSFYTPDDIEDIGINCFIRSNNSNIVFASAGLSGNIYNFTGTELSLYKTIRDVTTTINSYNSTTYKGKPLFAIGDSIYSIFKKSRGMDFGIVKEYTCSSSGATIHSITAVGSRVLIAWENGSSFGVDTEDTDRATGVIQTPIVLETARDIIVKYNSLPTGTSISIKASIDGGSFTTKTVEVDANRQSVSLVNDLGQVNSIQAQVTLNPSGSDTPVIEQIIIK